MAKNFIQKAIKHPGRLTEAAHRAGVSKHAMAEKWAHSDDPSKRGAGNLGLRFMKGGDLHGGNTKLAPSSMKAEAMRGRADNLKCKAAFRAGNYVKN